MRAYLLLGAAVMAIGGISTAEARSLVRVSGYVTSRGTVVAPYYRTKADGILTNNLSYRPGSAGRYVSARAVVSAGAASVPSSGSSLAPIEEHNDEPWCVRGRIVGSGAGFCIMN